MVLACRVKSRNFPAVRMVALLAGVECDVVDQDDRDTYFDLTGVKSEAVVRESIMRGAGVFILDRAREIPLPRRAAYA